MRTWREAACFSPPAYVCVGRRALIHKQPARSFVRSRQSSQAATGTSGPNSVSEETDTGAVADSAIVSFPVRVGPWPTRPLILPGTPNMQTSVASQVLLLPRPVHLAHPAWSPRAAGEEGLGGIPRGAVSVMGPFPPGVRASVLGTETRVP